MVPPVIKNLFDSPDRTHPFYRYLIDKIGSKYSNNIHISSVYSGRITNQSLTIRLIRFSEKILKTENKTQYVISNLMSDTILLNGVSAWNNSLGLSIVEYHLDICIAKGLNELEIIVHAPDRLTRSVHDLHDIRDLVNDSYPNINLKIKSHCDNITYDLSNDRDYSDLRKIIKVAEDESKAKSIRSINTNITNKKRAIAKQVTDFHLKVLVKLCSNYQLDVFFDRFGWERFPVTIITMLRNSFSLPRDLKYQKIKQDDKTYNVLWPCEEKKDCFVGNADLNPQIDLSFFSEFLNPDQYVELSEMESPYTYLIWEEPAIAMDEMTRAIGAIGRNGKKRKSESAASAKDKNPRIQVVTAGTRSSKRKRT